ncbi:MBL fold metallo-hydrolase [Aestuariibacter salexigens]|uniref:MBL fold metallo-hydrolase n=1 Tax=Aestuariibacter salexigens TaxID=226010 RepID=UPI0003F876B2|nr:MBL fold metallo-hydrolase [Aestuariibacter salexigens]
MLEYPEYDVPKEGELTKIADGVFWLRMPLPFELNHINLYLLEDNNGFFIVDTGIGGRRTAEIWSTIIDRLNKPITGVIVTHMHPDHIGQAGALCEAWKVPLYMTAGEYFAARTFRAGAQGATNRPDIEHYRSLGLGEDFLANLSKGGGGYSSSVEPIPVAFTRLYEGRVLTIGEREWQVMIGRGHSPEHACLYCAELGILLSGDHILPAISPNIGVYSTEPTANPLADYLTTLVPFKSLPKDTLGCPAHGLPFTGISTRIDKLTAHHHQHLLELQFACQTPLSAKDCLPVLFKRELSGNHLFFALAESLSHLNYLMYEGKLERNTDSDGVYRFRTVGEVTEPVGDDDEADQFMQV